MYSSSSGKQPTRRVVARCSLAMELTLELQCLGINFITKIIGGLMLGHCQAYFNKFAPLHACNQSQFHVVVQYVMFRSKGLLSACYINN